MQSGMIEVYTEFEGKEFVIERLFKGSIVNYRTFFMQESGSVSLRFAAPSVLKVLSKDRMNQIASKHPELGNIFSRYKLRIIKDGKIIPLDYVMSLPKKITDQLIKDTRKKMISEVQDEFQSRLYEMKENFRRERNIEINEDQVRVLSKQLKQELVPDQQVIEHRKKINLLENKLKNIVVRQIVKIREDRNKQTIKEAVDAILRSNLEAKDKRSKKVEKYVKREFEAAAAQAMDDEDILYNKVIVNMKRLLKVLTGHSTAIDSLERKLREISAPKKKKKAAIAGVKAIMNTDEMSAYYQGENGELK